MSLHNIPPQKMTLKGIKFLPVFSTILKQKILCLFIIIIPLLVLLIYICDIYPSTCLFYTVTKLPCPACGLTRAFTHALTGNWHMAIKLHLLIPILFLFWFTTVLITLLPEKPKIKTIGYIEKIEQKTGFSLWFLAIYFCYGIARISIQAYNLY